MNNLIEKILTEWSYRVYDGMPNPQKPTHLIHLKKSLEYLKINEDAVDYIMNRLYEKEGEKLVKNPKPGKQNKDMVTLAYAKTFLKKKGVNVDDMSDDEIAAASEESGGQGAAADDTETTDTETTDTDESTIKNVEMSDEQVKKEAARNTWLDKIVEAILLPKTDRRGAGVNRLSRKDSEAYHKYLQENSTPEGKREWEEKEKQRQRELEKKNGPVTDEAVDDVINKMQPDVTDKKKYPKGVKDPKYKEDKELYTKTRTAIIGKGGPPSKYTSGTYPDKITCTKAMIGKVSYKGKACKKEGDPHPYAGESVGDVRYRNIIKLYIRTGGRCPITGEKIALQDMELDHIVSLDNDGKDEPENWMLTKHNINQFKSSKQNPAGGADIQEQLAKSPAERESEKGQNDFKNFSKNENRQFWKMKFSEKPPYKFTEKQLMGMDAKELDAVAYGHNLAIEADDTLTAEEKKARYIKRNQSQFVMMNLKGKKKPTKVTYTRGGNVLRPIPNAPETWGQIVDTADDKKVKNNKKCPDAWNTKLSNEKRFKAARACYEEARLSGGRGMSKEDQINEMRKRGIVTDKETDRRVNEAADNAIRTQPTRTDSEEKQQKKADVAAQKRGVTDSDRYKRGDTAAQQKAAVTKKMKEWEEKNPPPTHCIEDPEGKRFNPAKYGEEDKDYKLKKVKIPVDKKGKITKDGAKMKCHLEWEELRDKQRNYYWNQSYYDRKFGQAEPEGGEGEEVYKKTAYKESIK